MIQAFYYTYGNSSLNCSHNRDDMSVLKPSTLEYRQEPLEYVRTPPTHTNNPSLTPERHGGPYSLIYIAICSGTCTPVFPKWLFTILKADGLDSSRRPLVLVMTMFTACHPLQCVWVLGHKTRLHWGCHASRYHLCCIAFNIKAKRYLTTAQRNFFLRRILIISIVANKKTKELRFSFQVSLI